MARLVSAEMKSSSGVTYVEPFLKWAGGKRLLLPALLEHIERPQDDGTYFEPFLGGGAVFFGLEPKNARLSDASSELINAFIAVRDSVEDTISHLQTMRHSKEDYYRIRGSRPRLPCTRAARFIYLNKTCFNGLYRVNLKGQFNVPFGRHPKTLVICNTEQLRNASRALPRTHIEVKDFYAAMKGAGKGDVVYCDPPYTVAHSTNGFIEYNAQVFSWADQERLAIAAGECAARGAKVYISNADHPSIRELYQPLGFRIEPIRRWTTMAGSSANRFKSTELLLIGDTDG
jgi:DNA adenine methylase